MLISAYDWLFHASQFAWTLRLYIAAAAGQTLFVALWAVLPWWKTVIGRALMIKSAALMVILNWSLTNYYFGPFAHQQEIGLGLFALVALGIWLQLAAIVREVVAGRRLQETRRP